MGTKSLVVGSIAFDHIFSIQPSFKKELPLEDGELKNVNMTFVASSDTTIIYGGTGSNIAYSHALISDQVLLFSAVGNDFKSTMGKDLVDMGVDDRTVVIDRDTARSLQITDENGEQMIVWQPNAYEEIGNIDLFETISKDELTKCNYAIFSPGTPVSIIRHIDNYRSVNKSGEVYFDPGQMINFYTEKQFKYCVDQADVLLINEVELNKINKTFNLTKETLLQHNLSKLIITKGAKGSTILTEQESIDIPAYSEGINEHTPIEATGAGDSYRGAMLGALTRGFDFYNACKIGSVVASLSVRYKGGQFHKITLEEALQKIELL